MRDPALHAGQLRKKEKDEEKNKGKQKNKIEAFHSLLQAIVPFIKEIWKDRYYIDRRNDRCRI